MTTSITGCQFVGVKFDEAAVDAIEKVADALIYNAQAITANAQAASELLQVFKASNVHIETMVKIMPEPIVMAPEAPVKKKK